jgi:hypothetical protein
MNLWAKRTGQLLLIAVLFLMSCEDDTFLLGFKDQVNKFEVKYEEFLVGDGSVISIDSVITDNNTTYRRILIGEDTDPTVGTVRAEAFAEFFSDGVKLDQDGARTYVYDSIVLQLHIDGYTYGLEEGDAIGDYKVYPLVESLTYSKEETYPMPGSGKEVLVKIPTRYYTNSSAQSAIDPYGVTSFKKLYIFDKQEKSIPTNITLSKIESAKDTLIASARLDDLFGSDLFNVALYDIDKEFSDTDKFKAKFKGLSIIPEQGNSVLGFNPLSKYTRVRLYYHSEIDNVKQDSLAKDFNFTGVSFHKITTTRENGLPSSEFPYTGTDPGSLRVIQGGDAMITKLDISKLYDDFIDQIEDRDIIINAAELVIENVTSSDAYPPIQLLELRLMQEDDSYLNYKMLTQEVRDSIRKFYIFNDGRHYFVNSDFLQTQTPLAASLSYNSTKNMYSGSVTLFIQNLFGNKNSSYRFKYLGIYPGTSMTGSSTTVPAGKTLNRAVFSKENIKLRVYYTQANKSNL